MTAPATRDVVYTNLQYVLDFLHANGESFNLKSIEPEPEAFQISIFFITPEITDEIIEDYIKEKQGGILYKIQRHTYVKYRSVQNAFVTLYMKQRKYS